MERKRERERERRDSLKRKKSQRIKLRKARWRAENNGQL